VVIVNRRASCWTCFLTSMSASAMYQGDAWTSAVTTAYPSRFSSKGFSGP
jgi:hypothetical protein